VEVALMYTWSCFIVFDLAFCLSVIISVKNPNVRCTEGAI